MGVGAGYSLPSEGELDLGSEGWSRFHPSSPSHDHRRGSAPRRSAPRSSPSSGSHVTLGEMLSAAERRFGFFGRSTVLRSSCHMLASVSGGTGLAHMRHAPILVALMSQRISVACCNSMISLIPCCKPVQQDLRAKFVLND